MDKSSLQNSQNDSFRIDEQKNTLTYLKNLYTLYSLELMIAFIWSSFCLSYPDSFSWVTSVWWLGLIALIISAILVVFTLISHATRESPLNIAVYFLFTLTFTYGMGWLCMYNTSCLVYFTLTTVTMIAFGFMLYSIFANTHMQTIPSLLFVVGFSLASFITFILLSDISFTGMLLCYFACVIFGFYINYDVRRNVRFIEDAFSGAVRIWGEAALVLCRLVELLVGIFKK